MRKERNITEKIWKDDFKKDHLPFIAPPQGRNGSIREGKNYSFFRAGFYKLVLRGLDVNGGGWGNLLPFSSFMKEV